MLLQVFSYAAIAVAFFVEALFIYAYPALIVERKSVFGAIARSFGVVKHVLFTTVLLVFIPRLLEVLFMVAKQKQQGLMNLTFPEITLFMLAAGIIISFISDSLVFLSTANLFILKQETEKENK
jgi:membrane-anchored glycerophosphoryl diester phosphodiesterase (GDPDase)